MTKEGPYGIDIDMKVRSDLKNVVDTAELKGFNKGIEQCAISERRKNAKAMKDLGMPLETIAKVTGMSVEDIAEL